MEYKKLTKVNTTSSRWLHIVKNKQGELCEFFNREPNAVAYTGNDGVDYFFYKKEISHISVEGLKRHFVAKNQNYRDPNLIKLEELERFLSDRVNFSDRENVLDLYKRLQQWVRYYRRCDFDSK